MTHFCPKFCIGRFFFFLDMFNDLLFDIFCGDVFNTLCDFRFAFCGGTSFVSIVL